MSLTLHRLAAQALIFSIACAIPDVCLGTAPPDPLGLPVPTRATLPTITSKYVLFTVVNDKYQQLFLAGTFNRWAQNHWGSIADARFAMHKGPGNLWYKYVSMPPGVHEFKFVGTNDFARFDWWPDPRIPQRGKDNNTVYDFAPLFSNANISSAIVPPTVEAVAVRRAPVVMMALSQTTFMLGDQCVLSLAPTLDPKPQGPHWVCLMNALGQPIAEQQVDLSTSSSIVFPVPRREGGYALHIRNSRGILLPMGGTTAFSVVRNFADDVRYGFYSNYGSTEEEAADKAELFLQAGVNTVEFYDYCVHGDYAPDEWSYRTEPFNVPVKLTTVKARIDANRQRGIRSVAYVAAYAGSRRLFSQYPWPMTDSSGDGLFYGADGVLSGREYDRRKKDKWIPLMGIHSGSPWRDYIIGEFESVVRGGRNSLVEFDGLEVDSYGVGGPYSAKGFVGSGSVDDRVHDLLLETHSVLRKLPKPSLLTYNSIGGSSAKQMSDAVDFLFMELWPWDTQTYERYAELLHRSRSFRNQRVVTKCYPNSMRQKRERWSAENLRLLMGTAMLAGANLMVAGEPDALSRKMHALKTDYYPTHVEMTEDCWHVLRSYNRFDALCYGITHGPDISNAHEVQGLIPDSICRGFRNTKAGALAVAVLRLGHDIRWTDEAEDLPTVQGLQGRIVVNGSGRPRSVWFGTPDREVGGFGPVPFELRGNTLLVVLPRFKRFGVLLLFGL